MEIVVNEWLLDYMCPDADTEKGEMAIQFINALVKKCDKMVIGRQTPFVSKFYHYMKTFGWENNFKKRFSKLNQLFHNSDKTIILDDTDIETLPKELVERIPLDDKYLIELAYSSRDKTIVTTDKRLKEKLQDEVDLKIYLLDDFFGGYVSRT